jgi:hypothetical protein
VEGLFDAPNNEAFFAQTSGLAATEERLWLVDSETSALRWIDNDGVHTAIGKGLFTFGHQDGDADEALLQHPLGVAVLDDGSIAIADTYNGAIRRYDPETHQVSTLARDIAEPSGIATIDGRIAVVASAAHRIEFPVSPGDEQVIAGKAHQVKRPPTELKPGRVELAVIFQPPPGQKLDNRYGPSTRLEITASPPELLLDGAGVGTDLTRTITLANIDLGVLHVVAQAASCDDDPAAEHPVCRVTRQDWGVPVRMADSGLDRLPLMLGGMDG